jgi:hypothetical protein
MRALIRVERPSDGERQPVNGMLTSEENDARDDACAEADPGLDECIRQAEIGLYNVARQKSGQRARQGEKRTCLLAENVFGRLGKARHAPTAVRSR